jgi:drug/metabolite transporter (DMT)-like permease
MPEVPPVTLAAWRLQLTGLLLGAGAAPQWARLDADTRRRTLRKARAHCTLQAAAGRTASRCCALARQPAPREPEPEPPPTHPSRAQAWLLAASGACLAVHFGTWVVSLKQTSLSHSLLFVSASPVFLAGGAWAARQPTSRAELLGVAAGAGGGALLAAAAAAGANGERATLAGDLYALLAALALVGAPRWRGACATYWGLAGMPRWRRGPPTPRWGPCTRRVPAGGAAPARLDAAVCVRCSGDLAGGGAAVPCGGGARGRGAAGRWSRRRGRLGGFDALLAVCGLPCCRAGHRGPHRSRAGGWGWGGGA